MGYSLCKSFKSKTVRSVDVYTCNLIFIEVFYLKFIYSLICMLFFSMLLTKTASAGVGTKIISMVASFVVVKDKYGNLINDQALVKHYSGDDFCIIKWKTTDGKNPHMKINLGSSCDVLSVVPSDDSESTISEILPYINFSNLNGPLAGSMYSDNKTIGRYVEINKLKKQDDTKSKDTVDIKRRIQCQLAKS